MVKSELDIGAWEKPPFGICCCCCMSVPICPLLKSPPGAALMFAMAKGCCCWTPKLGVAGLPKIPVEGWF